MLFEVVHIWIVVDFMVVTKINTMEPISQQCLILKEIEATTSCIIVGESWRSSGQYDRKDVAVSGKRRHHHRCGEQWIHRYECAFWRFIDYFMNALRRWEGEDWGVVNIVYENFLTKQMWIWEVRIDCQKTIIVHLQRELKAKPTWWYALKGTHLLCSLICSQNWSRTPHRLPIKKALRAW